MKSRVPITEQIKIGDTFDRLKVWDGPHYFDKKGNKTSGAYWSCICQCGRKTHVYHCNLVGKRSRSCGCLCRERTIEALTTHGEASAATRTSEWGIWAGMKDRCNNPNDHAYKDYGGRGILVCDRWVNSYKNFITDMGRRPTKDHSLERNDTNGSYCLENCRWATCKEQARNRRGNVTLMFNGQTLCIAEWAEKLGIKESLIRGRIRYGWNTERALTEPSGLRSQVSHNERGYLLTRKRYLERELSRINEILGRENVLAM